MSDRCLGTVIFPVSDVPPARARRTGPIAIVQRKTHCAVCNMRELCLPVGLEFDALRALDSMVTTQTRFAKGETLFRAGDPFTALYAIRLGSCKTTILSEDGREQITGYHMLGDIIGLDGIGAEHHACEAMALEDIELCALPFDRLEALARTYPHLQHNLHQVLSRDIGRDQNMMMTLGSTSAAARLATFLLNLSERYKRRGYSSTEFVLRMTREEIGNFLGLKLETISRLLSRLQGEGLVQIQGRGVKLCDLGSLRRLAGHRS